MQKNLIGVVVGVFWSTASFAGLPGDLDVEFGGDGWVTTDVEEASYDQFGGAVVQPDGKLVVAGYRNISGGNQVAVVRYLADGELDESFGTAGKAIFNAHPVVYRSALVPRGERPNQKPVILIEPHPGRLPRSTTESNRLRDELLDLASRNPLTRQIEEVIIRSEPLPVDIRHNSKIFREQLAAEINS